MPVISPRPCCGDRQMKRRHALRGSGSPGAGSRGPAHRKRRLRAHMGLGGAEGRLLRARGSGAGALTLRLLPASRAPAGSLQRGLRGWVTKGGRRRAAGAGREPGDSAPSVLRRALEAVCCGNARPICDTPVHTGLYSDPGVGGDVLGRLSSW